MQHCLGYPLELAGWLACSPGQDEQVILPYIRIHFALAVNRPLWMKALRCFARSTCPVSMYGRSNYVLSCLPLPHSLGRFFHPASSSLFRIFIRHAA
ncbi:unnamed protein product [Protopolystoma xenopodis]|uniref:Uncharacterized protein n=1 Tax=Protopolystoma xenopodis TaxID=117903 RepID=A0A3S5BNY0_9PLAT|nr:unnamed protein product [Protopolystoma xenopodis]